MNAPKPCIAAPKKGFVLCSEEARWFAHSLFGRRDPAAAGEPGWRKAESAPRSAA